MKKEQTSTTSMTAIKVKKPFDIEAIKNGAECVTRDGRKAVYVTSVDDEDEDEDDEVYPHIFAIVNPTNTGARMESVTDSGATTYREHINDIFILGEPERKPFDLDKAQAGAQLITLDGRSAKFLTLRKTTAPHCVVVLITIREHGVEYEDVRYYTTKGNFSDYNNDADLFILE